MDSQAWFREQKWGVFTHFLYHEQNKSGSVTNMGKGETDWNECIDLFDVPRFTDLLAEAGAKYLMFTLQQGTRYLCAPNATFDRITGYRAGEACARRDLIGDILKALQKHGISLFLYFTGDGPYQDPMAGKKMGYTSQKEHVTMSFVENWAQVAREYSMRYGSAIKGWWVDGCYDWFGYNDTLLKPYAEAMKSGNPDALLAFNGGVLAKVGKRSIYDDYTCGEMNEFVDLPSQQSIDGAQWHILAPLGVSPDGQGAWCKPGCQHTAEYMRQYVHNVNDQGGVVTIDIALYRDGSLDPNQVQLLQHLVR